MNIDEKQLAVAGMPKHFLNILIIEKKKQTPAMT